MRGSSIGRYVILSGLGEGGMGVVYAAYDPELDRKVAVKVLRERLGDAAELRARLLCEAQAMARLSHPNVVAVYDVGRFEDKVFVAMEFIDGRTLGQWLKEKPRSWREVLAVFREAGKGLFAAHSAGLIHRDFKPGNVLVGKDESVKVTDFGLAFTPPSSPTLAPAAMNSETPSGTGPPNGGGAPGHVAGTPAYMAPEQLRGETLDARADQYSYCVALYEAFTREHPAEATTFATLASQLEQQHKNNAIIQVPKGAGVPGWVLSPVLRGLSVERAERFDNMGALLKALEEPRSPWKRVAAAMAIAAVVVSSIVGYRVAAHRQSLICRGAEEKLSGIWDPTREEAIHQAFLSTSKPYATNAFRGVKRALDAQTQAWVAMHTEACQATRLRGEQSEALLDLRMGCLWNRLEEMRALTDLFAKADAQVVESAVDATSSLTTIRSCADVTALASPQKMPENSGARAAVEKLNPTLAQARALLDTGKYSEGLSLARDAAAQAREIGFHPIEAEALLLLSNLQARSGDHRSSAQTLQESALSAEIGRHDEVRAKAWTSLVQTLATLGQFDEAQQWARRAASLVERLKNPLELNAHLESSIGMLLHKQGKYDEAVGRFKRALELSEKAKGSEDSAVAAQLNKLGIATKDQGKYDEALSFYRRALEISEKRQGPDHPEVANAMSNIGNVLRRQGKREAALDAHRRALEIREKAIGANSPLVATSLLNIGSVLKEQGRYPEALQYDRRALEIHERAFGPASIQLVSVLTNLGNLSHEMGEIEEALAYARRALAIQEKVLGPEHVDIAHTLNNLGGILHQAHDFKSARQYLERSLAIEEKLLDREHPQVALTLEALGLVFDDTNNHALGLQFHERALAIREKKLGPNHPLVAVCLSRIGRSLALAGKRLEALPFLERALSIQQKVSKPWEVAETQFQLAKILWDTRKDRRRAVELGRQAYAGFLTTGTRRREIGTVKAWLSPKLKGSGEALSLGI